MAWLSSKKALKYLRSHSGYIQVITERYSTAVTSHYKVLNPCVLSRKSLQFCSDRSRTGQQLWTQRSPAATATPSSKNSWSRLVVRALAPDYRRPSSCLLRSKLSFPRSAPASALKLSLGTQWVFGGCWSRLRHVCCWLCRAAQAPKASKNECQANQSSVSGWSPLSCPHTDIQCHLRCPDYPWLPVPAPKVPECPRGPVSQDILGTLQISVQISWPLYSTTCNTCLI